MFSVPLRTVTVKLSTPRICMVTCSCHMRLMSSPEAVVPGLMCMMLPVILSCRGIIWQVSCHTAMLPQSNEIVLHGSLESQVA